MDILEVTMSTNGNRYLLVVQDYFTKWAEAILLRDQTAVRIAAQLIKLFSVFGHPDIVHSDQGCNFESAIVAQTLEAFGVGKSHTTAYHPQGDGMVERFNRSLLQLLCTYVDKQEDWEWYLWYHRVLCTNTVCLSVVSACIVFVYYVTIILHVHLVISHA